MDGKDLEASSEVIHIERYKYPGGIEMIEIRVYLLFEVF
jgi:hypothetical protein